MLTISQGRFLLISFYKGETEAQQSKIPGIYNQYVGHCPKAHTSNSEQAPLSSSSGPQRQTIVLSVCAAELASQFSLWLRL